MMRGGGACLSEERNIKPGTQMLAGKPGRRNELSHDYRKSLIKIPHLLCDQTQTAWIRFESEAVCVHFLRIRD